jgi:hypothetical protein
VVTALAGYLILERRPFAADRRSSIFMLLDSSVPLIGAVALSAAWSRYAGVGLTDDRYLANDSTVGMLRVGLGRTAELFHQAFGVLGWLDTRLPTPTYGLWIVCLVLVGVLVALCADRRIKFVLAAIGVIWVLYPAIYVVLAKTPQVWQGRYNLPLLGGVVMCGILGSRATSWASEIDKIARFCAGSWMVIEVLGFYQTLRRFMVGATGSVRLRGGWEPPINAWILIVVNAAAAGFVAWLLTRPGSSADAESRFPEQAAVSEDDVTSGDRLVSR